MEKSEYQISINAPSHRVIKYIYLHQKEKGCFFECVSLSAGRWTQCETVAPGGWLHVMGPPAIPTIQIPNHMAAALLKNVDT